MKELQSTAEESIYEFIKGFRLGINTVVEILEEEMIKRVEEYFRTREIGELKPPPDGMDMGDIGLVYFMKDIDKYLKKIKKELDKL